MLGWGRGQELEDPHILGSWRGKCFLPLIDKAPSSPAQGQAHDGHSRQPTKARWNQVSVGSCLKGYKS